MRMFSAVYGILFGSVLFSLTLGSGINCVFLVSSTHVRVTIIAEYGVTISVLQQTVLDISCPIRVQQNDSKLALTWRFCVLFLDMGPEP